MKILILLLFPFLITAQTFPMKDGLISYNGIEELPGKSKKEIISSAKLWFSQAFKDSRSVLELVDDEAGRLVGNGSLGDLPGVTPKGYVLFTVNIDCKDGKYRYNFTHFQHKWYSPEPSHDGGPLEAEKAIGGAMSRMQTRVFNNYKEYTYQAMPQVVISLIESMAKSSKKDDW